MAKKKIAILLLIALLFNVMQVTVLATESEPREYLAENGPVVLNEDITANGCDGVIYAGKGADVTINGGAIHALICGHGHVLDEATGKKGEYAMAVWADGGKVTINGGTFTNDPDQYTPAQTDLIYVKNGGQVIINGGSFKSSTPQWTLNASDQTGENHGTITVMGGKFYEFNPANNTVTSDANKTAGKLDVVVPDGYSVVPVKEADGTWYHVQKLNPAKIIDGETVTLNENITANGCDGAIYAKNGANVTITGGAIHAQICGDKHVTNGKLGEYAMAVWADASKVTIKGGTFTNDADPYTPAQTDLIYVKNGGEIVIEGGSFKSSTPQWTLNSNDSKKGTITVKGGKFYQFNPALAGVEGSESYVGKDEVVVPVGYKVVGPDAEGYYEVVCAHITGDLVAEIPATYKAEGRASHWVCELCSKVFTDATKTVEVTDTATLVIPKLAEVTNNNADVTTNAFDEAIGNSVISNSSTVVIPTVETEETVTSVTVPVSSLKDVADANKDLSIETSEVTVTLDTKAIEKVVEQVGTATDIKIEVKKVEDTALNAEQKEALKDKEVAHVLKAEIIANGQKISDFGGGKVTVEIPFTPAEGAKGSDYKVIYIADDGKVTEIATKYVDGALIVELEHFSEYAIIKVATTSGQGGQSSSAPAGGTSAPAATPSTPAGIVKTGDNIVVYIAILLVSVFGAAFIITKKFKTKK